MEIVPLAFFGFGLLAALTVIACMSLLGNALLESLALHDLAVETHQLRLDYATRLHGIEAEVEVIGEPLEDLSAEAANRSTDETAPDVIGHVEPAPSAATESVMKQAA